MSQNIGVAPPDPLTKVGQFRILSGDNSFSEAVPPQPGFGEYTYWSDSDIEAILSISDDSIFMALSLAYANLAASAVSNSVSIKTDDLAYNSEKRSAEWTKLAEYWMGRHDAELERLGYDGFQMVQINPSCRDRPEASPPWFGGC